MSFLDPRLLASLAALGVLTGCLSISKGAFDSTTTASGALKASDAASHSRAMIRREGSEVVVQEAYRFDLASLVEVDAGYVTGHNPDEGQQTKDETIISMAIHGAFGMGTFNPVLDKIDSPWAKGIMAKTRIGRPFLVRSLSPKRDDYYVVPVLYKGRWGVANHVGVTRQGTYYSNGFTVPNMPLEKAGTVSAYGRKNLEWLLEGHAPVRAALERSGPVQAAPERVWLETDPPQEDAVLGYLWLVQTAKEALLVDTRGRLGRLSPEEVAKLEANEPLETPIRLR